MNRKVLHQVLLTEWCAIAELIVGMVADTIFILYVLYFFVLGGHCINVDLTWVDWPRELVIAALFKFRVD